MKSFIRRQFDRLVKPANCQIMRRQRGDSYDLGDVAFLEAAFDSVRYQQAKFPLAKTFANNLALLTHAMSIRKKGLVLEFGLRRDERSSIWLRLQANRSMVLTRSRAYPNRGMVELTRVPSQALSQKCQATCI